MSPPTTRLSQVAGHLAPAQQPHATRFRPKLPKGLHPSITPLNPVSYILKAATIRPKHLAISHPEKGLTYTYEQWATRVSWLAYALKAKGVKKGDRVAIIAPNVPFMADALQAIPAIQAILVPINVRLTHPEVTYLLENSGAVFILVDRQFKDLVADSKVPFVICDDSGKPEDGYEKLLKEGEAFDRAQGGLGWEGHEFQADENATFAISYTSGTTSRPKGVETTYRGTYLAGAANAIESGLGADSTYLWILPMFHCLGWCYPYAITMAMATQICLRQVGDYNEVWKSLLERNVTHYCGAPTVQLAITSHPHARKVTRAVRTTVAGAAPTATLIKGLEELGIAVTHVYGLTESYGPMTQTYFDDPSSKTYYQDKARQGHSFVLADDIRVVKLIPEGEELDVKEGDLKEVRFDGTEVGEIVMRGNLVLKGYYKNEEATNKAFAGGYFHTGDLAVRREDGTFAIQDRSKDIIISGGENVSSLTIESALTAHPDVHEVACVARPHEKYGERPHAFVVLKDPSSWKDRHHDLAAELKAFLKGKIAGFAIPEWFEVLHELEKTSTGKVQKNVLRERFKKNSPSTRVRPDSIQVLSSDPSSSVLSGSEAQLSFAPPHLVSPHRDLHQPDRFLQVNPPPPYLSPEYTPTPPRVLKMAESTFPIPFTQLLSSNGNFSVSVYRSDGTPQEVFKPSSSPTKNLGYIESRAGEEFTVRVMDLRQYANQMIGAGMYLDGELVDSYAMDPAKRQSLALFKGRRQSAYKVRPFKFGSVKLTDDDTLSIKDEKILKAVGSIEIRLCRIIVQGPSHHTVDYTPSKGAPILNERSKKATLSHVVELGEEKNDPVTSGPVQALWQDSYENPWITFTLLYRSRALLELQDIAPALPTPATLESGLSNGDKKKRPSTGNVIYISDSDDDAARKVKPEPVKKKVKREKEACRDFELGPSPSLGPAPQRLEPSSDFYTSVFQRHSTPLDPKRTPIAPLYHNYFHHKPLATSSLAMVVNNGTAVPLTKLFSEDKVFSMSVLVNGVEQEVHQPKSLPNSNSAYIENGEKVEGYSYDPNVGRKTSVAEGQRNSDTSIRPFRFSSVKLTDNDDLAVRDEKTIKGVGLIEVRIHRIFINGVSLHSPIFGAGKVAPVLHERQKKATLSHVAELGAAKYAPPSQSVNVDWHDPQDGPWITFKLLYRSRALLELEDIVPTPDAPPAPVAGPSNENKKKRPSTGNVLYISDSDDDVAPKIKPEKKVKKENAGPKKEKVVIYID